MPDRKKKAELMAKDSGKEKTNSWTYKSAEEDSQSHAEVTFPCKEEREDAGEYEASEEKPDVKLVKEEREETCEVENKHQEFLNSVNFPACKEDREDAGEYEASDRHAEEKPVVVQVKQERDETCDVKNKQQELLNSLNTEASGCLKAEKQSSDTTADEQTLKTTDKSFICIYCGDVFRIYSNLKNHLKTHAKEKRFSGWSGLTQETCPAERHVCSVCGKELISLQSLKNHQTLHDSQRVNSHVCSTCGKTFYYLQNLKSHQKLHTQEKRRQQEPSEAGKSFFTCQVCHRHFACEDDLDIHSQTHRRSKKFQCQQCGMSFHVRYSLKCHSRIHTGEKPYVCSQCGKSFSQKGNLIKHTNTHTPKTFTCSHCGKTVSGKRALNYHLRTHTE